MTVPKASEFYNEGLCGNSLAAVDSSIGMKICLRVRLKPSIDQCEFELDRARCNKNIAKKLFALGHETDRQ